MNQKQVSVSKKEFVKIKLRSDTLELLTSVGHENESFEQIIRRLIDDWKKDNHYF